MSLAFNFQCLYLVCQDDTVSNANTMLLKKRLWKRVLQGAGPSLSIMLFPWFAGEEPGRPFTDILHGFYLLLHRPGGSISTGKQNVQRHSQTAAGLPNLWLGTANVFSAPSQRCLGARAPQGWTPASISSLRLCLKQNEHSQLRGHCSWEEHLTKWQMTKWYPACGGV